MNQTTKTVTITVYPPVASEKKKLSLGNCDRCGKITPVPRGEDRNKLFGKRGDRGELLAVLHVFEHWYPKGWKSQLDQDTTYHYCPSCLKEMDPQAK